MPSHWTLNSTHGQYEPIGTNQESFALYSFGPVCLTEVIVKGYTADYVIPWTNSDRIISTTPPLVLYILHFVGFYIPIGLLEF